MAIVMSGNVAVPLDKELDADGIQDLLLCSYSVICVYSDTYIDIVQELAECCPMKFLPIRVLEQEQKTAKVDYTMLDKWNTVHVGEMAALFFTSGTNGRSKGVMLSQGNMMANINFACKNFFLSGETLAVLPFHHAFGLLTSVFAPLNYERMVFINSSLKNVKRDMLEAKPKGVGKCS